MQSADQGEREAEEGGGEGREVRRRREGGDGREGRRRREGGEGREDAEGEREREGGGGEVKEREGEGKCPARVSHSAITLTNSCLGVA